MKNLRIIILIIYVLILGHFIYSNFVKVIGPNYLIQTSSYNQDYKLYGCLASTPRNGCIVLDCVGFGDSASTNLRGFPFSTNNYEGCGIPFPEKDFSVDVALNTVYIIAVTAIAITIYIKAGSSTRQR